MVRVAIVVEQNWNTVPGGTARSVNRLIDELLLDPSVDLVGVRGSGRSAPTLALPTGLETTAVPVPGRLLTQLWNRGDRPRIERWCGPVDVAHGPAYVMPGSSAAAVATVHDVAFLHEPKWFTAHGVRFFTRFLDRLVEGGQHLIVPSETTAADCRAYGVDPDRISVIPWGSDPVDVDEDTVAEVMSRHRIRDDAVLYVGTVEPRKNLDGLVAAMRQLPDRQLVIVGPSGWGDVDLGDAIVLGAVPDRDVAALMAGCAALVYPSHYEGFGLPVLEAMGQGTPVIVTAGTAPAEVAGEGGVAVDTSDPEVLAGAIDGLLTDENVRRAIGAQGRRRSATYTWSNAATRTVEVYGRALA